MRLRQHAAGIDELLHVGRYAGHLRKVHAVHSDAALDRLIQLVGRLIGPREHDIRRADRDTDRHVQRRRRQVRRRAGHIRRRRLARVIRRDDAVRELGVRREAGVKEDKGVGAHAPNGREVGATIAFAALDRVARFVVGVVRPGDLDLVIRDGVGCRVGRRRRQARRRRGRVRGIRWAERGDRTHLIRIRLLGVETRVGIAHGVRTHGRNHRERAAPVATAPLDLISRLGVGVVRPVELDARRPGGRGRQAGGDGLQRRRHRLLVGEGGRCGIVRRIDAVLVRPVREHRIIAVGRHALAHGGQRPEHAAHADAGALNLECGFVVRIIRPSELDRARRHRRDEAARRGRRARGARGLGAGQARPKRIRRAHAVPVVRVRVHVVEILQRARVADGRQRGELRAAHARAAFDHVAREERTNGGVPREQNLVEPRV